MLALWQRMGGIQIQRPSLRWSVWQWQGTAAIKNNKHTHNERKRASLVLLKNNCKQNHSEETRRDITDLIPEYFSGNLHMTRLNHPVCANRIFFMKTATNPPERRISEFHANNNIGFVFSGMMKWLTGEREDRKRRCQFPLHRTLNCREHHIDRSRPC